MKFTIEEPVDNVLPYLDTRIQRRGNGLINDWYCKPTAKNRILNFLSAHNITMKINTARGMINRIFGLSDRSFWDKNVQLANNILLKNNYPKNLINNLITSVKNKLCNPSPTSRDATTNDDEQNYYSSITYVRGLSEKISKLLKTKCPETTISYKSRNTVGLKCFTKLKDQTPLQEKSSVVYKIECKDCDKVYIGQTKQKMRSRNYGHKSKVREQQGNGGLASHALEHNHVFDFDGTKILEQESNYYKRRVLEGIHIFLSRDYNVNDRDELGDDYSCIYNNILLQ